MNEYKRHVEEAAQWIQKRMETPPIVGFVAGTGLEGGVPGAREAASLAYARIPHFPRPTAPGHAGRLVHGAIQGVPFAALQGRFHLYEGWTPLQVVFPIRVLQALGVKILIFASAAGGLNPEFNAGDVMLVADHINLSGENPLAGPNVDSWGPRFPEMTRAYDESLLSMAREAAGELGVPLQTGVYAGLKGPSLETPAEIRFLQIIGADAVGLSTVNEVIAAVHGGMRVLGFVVITNMNTPGRLTSATVEDILASAREAAPKVAAVVERILPRLSKPGA